MMRSLTLPTGAASARGIPLIKLTTHKRIAARQSLVVRAEGKIVREYNENDDKISVPGSEGNASGDPNSVYADELPPIPRTEMSKEMKARLREEYYGLGGSPNKPMGGNYFLYIILVISFLAILSAALGYI